MEQFVSNFVRGRNINRNSEITSAHEIRESEDSPWDQAASPTRREPSARGRPPRPPLRRRRRRRRGCRRRTRRADPSSRPPPPPRPSSRPPLAAASPQSSRPPPFPSPPWRLSSASPRRRKKKKKNRKKKKRWRWWWWARLAYIYIAAVADRWDPRVSGRRGGQWIYVKEWAATNLLVLLGNGWGNYLMPINSDF